ncbi:protein-glutamate O-methyltransferase [Pseudaminobacter soli (ex Li et al. 2025)]|uniref:Chemotaxis protein methyltransferase n=1 Tax=Pseudaminobacter soli (ex Li et al. 2025) TaxID=1295366 RepID=A0A2P7RJC1_9HYPH|nr:protein-glutamate O-methyltransferase [Mesorhizobium soli]PSJ50313.1 chemotaxis protein [Mesorhizobium soli]
MSELDHGTGPARRRSIVAGEFVLTSDDMRQIAAMLHADAGIYLTEAKATLVYSRLSKRLRSLGLESFRDYCSLVASREGLDERQKMLAALTTNVTNFYREPHHFEHLARTVLPPLLDAARRGARVRLWSAACSNGAEPYTLALTILSLLPEAAGYDIKILATDIDANMIAAGNQGVYSDAALRPVPAELRRRWFVPVRSGAGKEWGVADELRQLVAFRELNLIAPSWPMKGRFQAIFCRNVVIYFEEATQAKIWSRFVPLLTEGGHLYIGHSERVSGPAAADFQPAGITTYKLREAGR